MTTIDLNVLIYMRNMMIPELPTRDRRFSWNFENDHSLLAAHRCYIVQFLSLIYPCNVTIYYNQNLTRTEQLTSKLG